MTTVMQQLQAQANQRGAERLARVTSKALQVTSPTTRVVEEVRQESHVVRPAWGTLPIDRMCVEDAFVASNKSGRNGLQAYMRAWGIQS